MKQLNDHTFISPSLNDLGIESLQYIEQEWDQLPLSAIEESITLFPGASGNSPPQTPPSSPRVEQEQSPSPPHIPIMANANGVGGGGGVPTARPP